MEKLRLRLMTETAGFIYAGAKCVKFTHDIKRYLKFDGKLFTINTRYLHASADHGPVAGETDLILRSGEGWRDYIVI